MSGAPKTTRFCVANIDEIEADARPGDLPGQVREHPRAVLDVHHDHLALATDADV